MKKKFFAIVLAFCMVLTMMPGMAWADGQTGTAPQENLRGLTLHGGGYEAAPNEGNIGNGLFTQAMTVKYNGEPISNYEVSVEEDKGTVQKHENGSFDFIPKQAGTYPITITYQNEAYIFRFFVSENDLPHVRYFYGIQENESMMPHNGRGFDATITGGRYDGKKYKQQEFEITNMESDHPNVIEVVKRNGGGYDLTAKAIGDATVTIIHQGFEGEVKKEIKIRVVDKKWYVDCFAENDREIMLPGSSVTFKANVRYFEYNSHKDSIVDGNKPYVLEWKLENPEQSNAVTFKPSDDSLEVAALKDAGCQEVPIQLNVYEAGTDGQKTGDPVGNVNFACYIDNEFYTIEVDGFNADLKKGETMTVVPALWHHYVEKSSEQIKTEKVTNVEFRVSDNNNLDIKEDNNKIIVTRPDAGDAGFGIEGRSDGSYKYDRWFELNWIEEDGDSAKPEHDTYFLGALPDNGMNPNDSDISFEDKYVNMSVKPDASANCFYFAIPRGKTYRMQAYRLINGKAKDSKEDGTTRDRDPRSLRCEGKDLFAEYFSNEKVETRTLKDGTYEVYKINLKQYLGHGDIRVLVHEDGDENADNWIDLRFVLNVTVKGDADGVKRIYNAADLQRNLFHFESEFPDVELVWKGEERTGTYYNAMDVYQEGGSEGGYQQGGFSELALELKDGYVLNHISFRINNTEVSAPFRVAREYDYAVYDDAGNMLPDFESNHFKDAGWEGSSGNYGGKVMSGPDAGKHKDQGFVMTQQVVLGNGAGSNTQQNVENFLKKQPYQGKQYSLKYLGALTNHLVFYEDYYDNPGTIEIIFDVQKLPQSSEFDGKIAIIPKSNQGGHKYVVTSEVLQEYNLTGKGGLNEKLQREYHENYSVEKVFEINATENGTPVSQLKSYVTISIPRSMFKGNPKHYKVMNIDDNGNMVEMETTYELNGDYIVFKTGHLSKYAIVTNENVNTGSESGGTSSGGAITPVPSDVATSGTAGDKVTTAKTEVKTSEKVHADGTKETIAEVKVSAANQREIIRQAKQNDSKEIILEVPARATGNATSANVQLEKAFLNQLLDETSASLMIKTPFGDAAYTQDELKALSEKTDGDIVTLAIAKEDPAAEEAECIAQAKVAAKQVDLKARSSTTSKGIKVVFKADAESKAFIESMKELGYTVKYRFYRSTKKASGYKAMLTKDKPVYVNTNGKTGAKYYYKVQLRAYDQNGRLIAATAVKQCKYACRTWTK